MFIGHALLAGGLAVLGSRAAGATPRRSLLVAALAALFATAPDVDILYALPGLLEASGIMGAPEAFWTASTTVHRGVTHSLLVGGSAAVVVAVSQFDRPLTIIVGLALVGLVTLQMSVLSGAILAVFLLLGAMIAHLATQLGIGSSTTFAAALLGFLTHPFGDLLTGSPPPLLAPLEVTLLTERLAPFADPTLNLLLAFAAELAVLWFGIWAIFHTAELELRPALDRRALLGTSAGLAVFVLAPPTMAASAHFVLPTVALGTVGAVPRGLPPRRAVPFRTALVTGLAAVTLGVGTYTLAYLLI